MQHGFLAQDPVCGSGRLGGSVRMGKGLGLQHAILTLILSVPHLTLWVAPESHLGEGGR